MADLFTSFGLIFLAELADKSRIVGLLLTTAFSSRWRVFWGMTLGYFVLDGSAVWVGSTMTHFFRGPWVGFIAGGIFVAFGVASFLIDDRAEAAALDRLERARHLGPFVVSFLAIGISEMGDRTQLSFAALSARTPQSWLILTGGMAALALLNLLTVLVGKALSERLRLSTIRKAGGAAFIAVGVATIAAALTNHP